LRYQPSLTGLLPFVNRSARAGSGKDSGDGNGNGNGDKTNNQEPRTKNQRPRTKANRFSRGTIAAQPNILAHLTQ